MDLPTSQNNAINIGLNRKGEQNSGDLSLTEADTVKNESTIGFGQAMYILLEVNNQTWSTAFMHLRQGSKPKGHFETAISAIDQHICNDYNAQQDLLDTLVDKVLSPKSHHHDPACSIAQYLILYSNSKNDFCSLLRTKLMSSVGRLQLGILRMISHITDQWKDAADTQSANAHYTEMEVGVLSQFLPLCLAIAIASPNSTHTSVLASDLVLILSRYTLHCLANPRTDSNSVGNGTTIIMELQEKDPKKKEDTIELLNKMLRIVHKISEWLDVSDLLIKIAWEEIQSFLKTARSQFITDDGTRQSLEYLCYFWDITSRALSSKHIRSKPKSMIKSMHIPNNLKTQQRWIWYHSTICSILIMNGNRYQLFDSTNGTNSTSTQKLDTELMNMSVQLMQGCLDIGDTPPGFNQIGSNLRVALLSLRGDKIESDELIQYQLEMLHLFPEDIDKFINYSSPNQLIKGIFNGLDQGTIGYSVCDDVLQNAIPKSDCPSLTKDICKYIGHLNSQINQLAQKSLVSAWFKREDCQDSLFLFIEYVRNVANGSVESNQAPSIQLSPANLLSGGSQPRKVKEAVTTNEKVNEMMNVIKIWATKAPKDCLESVLPMLTTKTYACRNDHVYTTIWKAISARISVEPDLVRIVTFCCVDIMEQQPRLTEEMINDPSDEGALAVQNLTFARLCPLLILLSFPETAFSSIIEDVDIEKAGDYWMEASSYTQSPDANQSLSMRLLQALLIRAEHIMEIQYIRPVALTVLAGLFGSQGRFLQLCRIKLQKLLEQWRNYHVVIKYWIYSFCVWAKGPWTRSLTSNDGLLIRQLKDNCLSVICNWNDIPDNGKLRTFTNFLTLLTLP
ncbi:hypothetical protein BGW37DRAFT_196174 [Umbelopsis sp. PMI_123]|nr:hypothetical protein BGW37DRAFT_196174 [Umbelopsis sp. PMI_123]